MDSTVRFAAAAALAVTVFAAPAHAQEDNFFKGKTVSVIVGAGPGGGFDIYARLLARYLPEHLAGNPNMIVQHMPGAATVKAASYIYNVAPQDGTAIGIPNQVLPLNALIRGEVGDGFDPGKFNWIGRLGDMDVIGIVWNGTGIASFADLKKGQPIFGGTSPSGSSVTMPMALNRLVGTKIKVVQGYKDTSEQYLAMERGEIQGMSNANWANLRRTRPEWIEQKKVIPIYQNAEARGPFLLDVPTVVELAEDEDSRRVLRLLASASTVGFSFYTGPKVPSARVATLRKAFMAMMESPALKEEAEKLNTPLNALPGENLQKIMGELASYPKELLDRAREVTVPE
jgi:tripartite-type tricarboxylate transporter receptor subunit TctC